MNTSQLKQFAQNARRQLIELVSTKLSIVLDAGSAARRENEKAVKDLEKEISRTSKDQVIEKVAYIWFNRFCALRFMDVNRYTTIGVVSPSEGFSQPEILMEAKQGHIDAGLRIDKDRVFGLLNETIPSPEPQQEAYRMLLVSVCNDYNSIMPFLFEKIADFTELLMPDDLLSESSILTATREALSDESCADVEVIGWLYQYYISEKKDEVFAGLKKNKKVTPENIPAATQLFTPNWIVRYLVENSLGRLWMLNNPGSRLIDRMEYYIKSEQEETDFLVIKSPEEIKICDPACGSGHMLVYAFEILYTIYEEEGYDAPKIPQLILENNLYGIEIDERAGELAAFALFMKAREKYRRFFRKAVQPNICVLENISFDSDEVKRYMDKVDRDLLTMDFQSLLYDFKEADNFGSLIRPRVTDIRYIFHLLDEKKVSDDLFLQNIHKRVLKVLKQSDYLNPKYHIVIANPPYMGRKGMNGSLAKWANDNYSDTKSDLFAMFIERCLELVLKFGYCSMVTMQSWMFLSSYEKLREHLMSKTSIENLAHMANMVMGIAFGTSATTWKNSGNTFSKGKFCFVDYEDIGKKDKPINFPPQNKRNKAAVKDHYSDYFFHASTVDFKKIPGSPIAYWVSDSLRKIFSYPPIESVTISDGQNKTGNNAKFVRTHWEVSKDSVGNGLRWFFYAKGGKFRRWYGNLDEVIDWSEHARNHYRKDHVCRIIPEYLWYKRGITWGLITSAKPSFRILPSNSTFDVGGSSIFFKNDEDIEYTLGLLNTKLSLNILKISNPTVNFQVKNIREVPFISFEERNKVEHAVRNAIKLSKKDWDSFETSWNFNTPSIFSCNLSVVSELEDPAQKITISYPIEEKLETRYMSLKSNWDEASLKLQQLEEEMNHIFIKSYELQNEFNSDVSLSEISLNCNSNYRYNKNKTDEEKEILLAADTMKEFISYFVGCMFGRYSLDKPGLILANQGDTIEDYLAIILEPTFKPDVDNVIPIMDVDWFTDDIAERFKKFLKVTFGEEHYTENLEFIEKAIGKDIRKFFLKDFYTYHVKMYKKRPIYWMFSSSKGSFNALIYMHRYKPDTVSIVLNDYLREFRTKLTARQDNLDNISISTSASQGERAKALKEIENIKKVLDEVDEYERDILYPLATKQIEIDLDDGVMVNYPKFGKALKNVAGLS